MARFSAVSPEMVGYVYLDHAATTPLLPGVLEAMTPYLAESYGNPSAAYGIGRAARAAVDNARDTLANCLGCESGEVYFTSGGTEAINMAIKGYARAHAKQGCHLLVSAIEHHAVLHAAQALEAEGFTVESIPVDSYGQVSVDGVATRIKPDTILVAVMHANNEVGTVQPIHELGVLCKEHDLAFMVDAVQTCGHIPVHMEAMGATFLTVSAHKFGGPKGVGCLLAKRGARFAPLLHGGGQEREKRAGTENVAGVVGMAKALRASISLWVTEHERMNVLANKLANGVVAIPYTVVSGHPTQRLPGFVHACFHHVHGESLVMNLDRLGFAAASGSACTTGSTQVSHVLLAMGVPRPLAEGALRLTLGTSNTDPDVERLLAVLPPLVERLRSV